MSTGSGEGQFASVEEVLAEAVARMMEGERERASDRDTERGARSGRFRPTHRARRELDAIVLYVLEQSGLAAARSLRADIRSGAETAASRPGAGYRRSDLAGPEIRFRSVHRHLVAYRWEDDPITAVRIVHGARDPGALGAGL